MCSLKKIPLLLTSQSVSLGVKKLSYALYSFLDTLASLPYGYLNVELHI